MFALHLYLLRCLADIYIIFRKPSAISWSEIPSFPIDCLLWSPEVPIAAEGKMCYEGEGLYVYLSTVEPNIRAENTKPLDAPCEDSCLEFFFSPINGDNRYFNIEVNPNGCFFLGFGSNRYNLHRLIPRSKPFSIETGRTENGWYVTYMIPWDFIHLYFPDFQALPGTTMRGNCYKCGDLTVQPHYLSWNPILLEKPDFHCPSEFGTFRFA